MRDRASQLANDITPEMLAAAAEDEAHAALLAQLGMRAALVVPMVAGGRAIGTLALVSAESGRRFSGADVELAEELARRAGTAVENARLYTERSRIARALQSGLLPDALPTMPGWLAKTLYRPAGEENWVGGDFYDAVPVPGGWLVFVGDVAGRGADAAALTALARHTLRSTAKLLPNPLDALAQLNDELVGRRRMSLCTVAAALLTERDGAAVADIVCAGHPPPLVVADGQVTPVGHFGPMLGAYHHEHWEPFTVRLAPGALLVLYTDGVLDTVGDGGRRFGEPRLQDSLTGAGDAEEAVARIDTALREFEVGEQADDTAVLAIQRVGVPDGAALPEALPESRA
jgi:serine phosphatase RsbU (regulator of sigma subunit)